MLRSIPALALAAILLPAAASAQGAVARVNGEAITSYDVQQRVLLAQVADRQRVSAGQALDLLVEENIKVFAARKIGFRITEDDLDKEITRIAQQRNATREQFEGALRQQGLAVQALRARLRADISWNSSVRHRFQASAPTNSEIEAEISKREQAGGAKVVDYVIHQVIFVVAGGAAGAAQANANSARGRFNGCEAGLEMLRGMRDVAVKPSVARSSTDLTKPLAEMLSKTPTGKLTQSYRTELGIEAIAVCERRDRTDRSGLRSQVERELSAKRIDERAAAWLKELKASTPVQRGG